MSYHHEDDFGPIVQRARLLDTVQNTFNEQAGHVGERFTAYLDQIKVLQGTVEPFKEDGRVRYQNTPTYLIYNSAFSGSKRVVIGFGHALEITPHLYGYDTVDGPAAVEWVTADEMARDESHINLIRKSTFDYSKSERLAELLFEQPKAFVRVHDLLGTTVQSG